MCLCQQGEEVESLGYIIPPPVITHFITDYERNGRYTAFPNLGVEWQRLESPHLRKALGMKVCMHKLFCALPLGISMKGVCVRADVRACVCVCCLGRLMFKA